jgi:adenosylcobinamide-phosphate synthase
VTIWLAALGWDLLVGEPPRQAHPVVWVGWLIAWLASRAPLGPRAQLPYGVGVVGVPALAAALLGGAVRFARPSIVRSLLTVWLLKTAFSLRALLEAGEAVEDRLMADDLDGARLELRSLVGRDRATLDRSHVVSAAIESTAENLSDSYVAPLFWYLVGGLPAALSYRAVNTADAMVGYRGSYEYVGKASARLDDLANRVPSRASALALAAAAPLVGMSGRGAIGALRRDHGRTASPNAGWPMAAAAGALGVWLENPGHHRLGGGRDPRATDIAAARRLVLVAAGLCTLVAVAAALWRRP